MNRVNRVMKTEIEIPLDMRNTVLVKKVITVNKLLETMQRWLELNHNLIIHTAC